MIVADEQEEFGGSLLDSRESLDGKPAMASAVKVQHWRASSPITPH